MSVLLVEDDPLIREFVAEALREAGYHVIHVSTGEEALAWCQRHVADVLVTDVRLPGQVDGWQIAERYRERAGLTDLDDLLGNQFGEGVVAILYANRSQGLFVSCRKPRDLFRPQRRVLKYSVDGQLLVSPAGHSVAPVH
ncbi:response regulator transcription factor [Bradyrhizobium sp. BR 1432]|uniref:response regulator transcription factor n=1 Tax=Bradyrhizobium sp. BR 1432 TaxID=3447966 RepID=UPI003EE4F022